MRLGVRASLPALSRAAAAQDTKLERPSDGARFAIVASGNVHGEREDCGCKANPLGGLTRHATMTALLTKASAEAHREVWGDEPAKHDVVLRADAGDLLFRHSRLKEQGAEQAKLHFEAARGIVAALNAAPPDVLNIGEIDLVLGWGPLSKLRDEAKFPFISANLRLKDGSAPLPSHAIVTRGGKKIAFIGLLKEGSFTGDYWADRELKVEPSLPAYLETLKSLPERVDLVVMLSNLGLADTERLVHDLRAQDARVDLAIVSNTGTMSPRPVWSAGVPIVEPGSRGKQLGRVDLLLSDPPSQARYLNGHVDPNVAIQEYGRKLTIYIEVRDSVRNLERRIAQLQRALPEASDALASTVRAQQLDQINSLTQQLDDAAKRLDEAATNLLATTAALDLAWSDATRVSGDDWVDWRVAPVKLSITEQPAVRKALDAHKVKGLDF
jgi:2',3'-cyclic-nucleotide 2'-phosphodiesterase (5'-nucleotidase family)